MSDPISDWLLAHEPVVRLGAFVGIFAAMAAWELVAARRPLAQPRTARWTGNLLVAALNALIMRALVPVAALAVAGHAAERGWGVLHMVELPGLAAVALAIVLLDLGIYGQHVLFHAVPFLWRLHVVHHTDRDVDVTTGARFHPAEILVSLAIKLALVLAIGPPLVAVLAFEVLLNATSMFNHANVRLPTSIDSVLRLAIVTPDMHRVHHSSVPTETNSNFGFNLPWWDRLFGTYTAQPNAGHDAMELGISSLQGKGSSRLLFMLKLPFVTNAKPPTPTTTTTTPER